MNNVIHLKSRISILAVFGNRNSCGCAGRVQIAILLQLLAIEPHFVRKGCVSCRLVVAARRLKREIEKKENARARGQESKRARKNVKIDMKIWRCEDEKMWKCEDEKMWRWEDEQMWIWEDVKMKRCEDVRMWKCEDVGMWRCEDVRMRRWEDANMSRCEDEKMWRWADVKMRRCEDVRMRGCEDLKMLCEDVKRWKCMTDPHY